MHDWIHIDTYLGGCGYIRHVTRCEIRNEMEYLIGHTLCLHNIGIGIGIGSISVRSLLQGSSKIVTNMWKNRDLITHVFSP